MPPVRTTCILTRQSTHTRRPQTHVATHPPTWLHPHPQHVPCIYLGPAAGGEDPLLFFSLCGRFSSHSTFGPQGSRIFEKVDLGPIPSTRRDGARDGVIPVVGGEACGGLPGIRHDCIPQPGRAGPNVRSASSAHAHQVALPFEPSSFLPLECSFPLSLPIEIFPLPQCLVASPTSPEEASWK